MPLEKKDLEDTKSFLRPFCHRKLRKRPSKKERTASLIIALAGAIPYCWIDSRQHMSSEIGFFS